MEVRISVRLGLPLSVFWASAGRGMDDGLLEMVKTIPTDRRALFILFAVDAEPQGVVFSVRTAIREAGESVLVATGG